MVSKQTFEALYEAIDHSRWGDLPSFFDDDVIYKRPGYADIVGITALRRFYEHIRVVASGKHTLNFVCSDARNWFVVGEFNGVNREAQTVSVTFCDHFTVKNAKFVSRQTFFFTPYT